MNGAIVSTENMYFLNLGSTKYVFSLGSNPLINRPNTYTGPLSDLHYKKICVS